MDPAAATPAVLRSVALRAYRMEAMAAFYHEAFGFEFRPVRAGGREALFGTLGDLTLKLVPLADQGQRDEAPTHQLGFAVPEPEAVVALAEKYGGGELGQPARRDGRVLWAVRDPDGNPIELYGPEDPPSPAGA